MQIRNSGKWFVWLIMHQIDTQGGTYAGTIPDVNRDHQCYHYQAPSGERCGSPALKGEYYCYHHHIKNANRNNRRVSSTPRSPAWNFP